ncbi:MAG: ribonuclease HII, partial [Gemmatimonadaceae bacterium]|nr:ribonuclease HII [Gloeobacterales cyanobacterium ES-bin-141]
MRQGSYPTLKLESSLWAVGLSRLAGVDEVGRGALAGCVVAAAVVLPPDIDRAVLTGIRDSKQLTRTRREALVHIIRAAASAIGIGAASPAVIDRLNIRRATALAMQRALNQLDIEHVLVDGLPVTELKEPQSA